MIGLTLHVHHELSAEQHVSALLLYSAFDGGTPVSLVCADTPNTMLLPLPHNDLPAMLRAALEVALEGLGL